MKLRDAFRVEALEPRVLLSADPIIGMAAVMLPDDTGHDYLIHDAYQGAAPADSAASHIHADQVQAGPAAAAPTAAPPTTAPAATVTIASADPGRTIFLGDDVAGGLDSNGALYVSNAALGDLSGGFSHILVGGADSNAHIVIGDTSGTEDIILNDSLTLMNPQFGGEIFINQKLILQGNSGLTIVGSGHTTIVSDDINSAFTSIIDAVKINGASAVDHTITLTATNGGIQIGNLSSHTINGFGTASDDRLVLSATGDIALFGTVGNIDPLEGIAITGAHNVRFHDAVTVNGDLFIHASGTVTFDKTVHLTAGNLHISGASQINFAGGVVIDGGGDVFLEGNEIDLATGEGGFIGTGTLTLRPTLVGMNIDVAGPPLENSADLNLSSTELAAFQNSFSKIIIGHQDGAHANHLAGNVRIGAIQVAQQFTIRDELEVYGKTITVEDFANAGFAFVVDGKITLDAYTGITLNNQVVAHNASVVLYSEAGAITQGNGIGADDVGSETVRGNNLHAHAGNGIYLPWLQVNSVSAVNTGNGDLIIGNLARNSLGATGGALRVDEASQASLLGDAIAISTSAGSITIASAGVHTVSGGAIGVIAGGAASQIVVNQGIGGTSGAITLAADGAIDVALGTIAASGAGAISLTSTSAGITVAQNLASAGGLVRLNAGGAIDMVSGTSIGSLDASGDTGAVTLNAVGDITVSVINADGAIGIASSAGAIIDGLTGNNNNLDGDTATAILAAAAGIGGSGGAGPLYTRVAALSAANSTAGNVFVREATALRLLGASLAGASASLTVQTTDGGIVVDGVINSSGSGSGNILLQSGELNEATAAAIDVRANIGSNLGNISIVAADNVLVNDLLSGAPLIEARATGKTIDIAADGAIALEAGARLLTNNGNIRLEALSGNLTLGSASAGTAAISLHAAAGDIVDNQGDDAATRIVNLSAANLRLQASGTIGSSTDTLEIDAAVVALSGRAGYLLGSSAMAVGSVAVAVNRVVAGDTSITLADPATLSGATTSNGDLVLTGAALTFDQAVSATGGNLRLQAAGTLTANATLTASDSITVLASGTITQNASAVLSAATGTIDVVASAGAIVMADGARALTNAANIRYQGATGVTVSVLDARSNTDRGNAGVAGQAGWGAVSVVAGAGIADAAETGAATDIYASALRLNAGAAVGTSTDALDTEALSLSGAAGAAMFVSEASAVTVGPVGAISVNRVLLDGSVGASVVTDVAQSHLTSAAALVLRAGGAITSVTGGAIAAGANLLLASDADIILGAAVSASAAGGASSGGISLNAGRDIVQNAAIGVAGTGYSIDLVATRDIVMADRAATTSNGGNIALRAGANVIVETLDAGAGAVAIHAAGSIADQDADGDAEADIVAASLLLSAGDAIGSGVNAIDTTVATLTARAGNGGLFIAETDGLIVDTVTVQINRIDSSGAATATAYAAQSSLAATGAGNVVLSAGALTISDDVGAAAGNILLKAGTGNLTLNNSVTSTSGAISLAAGAALAQKALVSGASVDALAATSLSMDDGATTTAAGNIRYAAGATMAIGALNAGAAVSLIADSVVDSGSADTDISAAVLRVETATGFGTGAAHLQTAVGVLAGGAGSGGLFIDDADALQIGAINAIITARVGADGGAGTVHDAASSGLAAGAALVVASAGALRVDVTVAAGGNLRLQTAGAASDLIINKTVSSGIGSISLAAGRDVAINAAVRSDTLASSIDIDAARDIAMAEGSAVTANSGNIALAASRNVTIELITSTSGSVSVTARSGAIIDGDSAGDTEEDIRAVNLVLRAGSGAGAADNHLETGVDALTAQGGAGGVYVSETNNLSVGTLAVQVNRVDSTGAASTMSVTAQSGLGASGSGNIVLRSDSGRLTLSGAVITTGGNILLQAASAGMVVNAAVSAGGGAISLASAGALAQHANIATSGAGTIDLSAAGALSMDDGTSITGAANIGVRAGATMTVGAIATAGAVSLLANAFVDSGSTDTDVSASALRIVAVDAAGSGIGSGAFHLQVAVTTLAGSSAGAGLYLDATGGIAIDHVAAININRVGADGATGAFVDAALSDLTSNGNLVLTASGAIRVNQGSANATGVRAAGNVLLQASGANADIVLNAEVLSTGGSVSVHAGRDLLAAGTIITGAAGASIDLAAARAVVMANNSLVQTNAGNIAVRAGGDVTIETLSAGSAGVALTAGGSIVDQDGAGDSEVDIVGAAVQLSAGGAIGSAASALETSAGTLSASAGGGIYVDESDALVLDSVAVQVNRVDASGATALTASAAQSNVSAGGNVAIAAAGLTVSDDVAAAGAIVLQARAGNLTLNNVVGATGSVSLLASGAIAQKTAINGGGSVDVAAGADIVMSDGAGTSATGNVRYAAGGNLRVGVIATAANASLSAATIVDAGGAEIDVFASQLRLSAGSAGNTRLQTAVVTLAAAIGGGLSIDDVDGLTVGSVGNIGVSRLALDGSSATIADAALAGLAASGNVLLKTGGAGDLTVADGVLAGGNISMNSARDIVQNAAIGASAAGASIDLLAGRSVTMSDAAVTSSDAGNIRLAAGAAVTIGALDARSAADRGAARTLGQAGWGNVAIAAAGAIADNVETTATVDVYASALRMVAGGGAGSATNYLETEVAAIAAAAGAGGLFVADASAIAINAIAPIGVNRVADDGSTAAVVDALQSGLTSAGGAVVAAVGAIHVGAGVTVAANLLLQSAHNIVVGAAVASSAGSISLNASGDIVQNAGVAIATAGAGKTIDLVAGGNIVMGAGSIGSTVNGNLLLQAGGDVTVAVLAAGTGSVGIKAAGSILDQNGAGDGDGGASIRAAGLQLKAGNAIGAGANHLELDVATLSASAGAGGMYLGEANGLTVAAIAVQAQRIDAAAAASSTANAAQADLRTAAGGNIVLRSTTGAVTLTDGDADNSAVAASGGGNVLLSADSIAVNARIASAGGNVSVLAAGAIAMAGNTGIGGAQVRLAAGGSITLGNVSAVSASIVAGGAIGAASGSAVNLNATSARLQAGLAIGSGGSRLSIAVDNLSASAAGMYISEADGIVINAMPGVLQVNADGGSSVAVDATLAGLVSTANGSIVISAAGSMAVADNQLVLANGGGNVLLQARGGALSLGANADVTSGSGHLTVLASGAVTLAAGADLRTAGSGDIGVEAGAGFTQAAGSVIVNANGSIALRAGTDVLLASISSGGNVAISALAGSISEDGDAAVDIAAEGVRLSAAGAIGRLGADAEAIDMAVATVSARAGGGGISLAEAGDVVVGNVAVSVHLVSADGSLSVTTVASQADLRTSANGSIVLDAATGFIILNQGSGAANGAVVADGSGNVLLNAGTAIIANADVMSATGHVTLLAATLIEFKANADIRSGGGAIDVEASAGAIVQHATSLVASASGNVRLTAHTSVTIGDIVSGGDVAITAVTGAIRDADILVGGVNDVDNDISARALRLSAGTGIGVVDLTGSTGNALEIAVGVISARAGSAIGLVNSGALAIGSAAGSAFKVGRDGLAVAVADPLQRGISATGAVALALDGDLSIDAGVSAASLNLSSARGIAVSSGVSVAATGGNATLDAKGGVLTMAGSAAVTASGNLRLHAAGDIMVGNLAATNVSLVADSGAIISAEGSSKNVSAVTLRLQAGDAIGAAARHLSTAVGTVSASARGADTTGIYLTEDDALIVGSTGFGVDAAQTDLRAASGSIVIDAGGAVSMAGSVNASATGALAIHAASISVGNLSAATVSLSADGGAIVNAAGSSKNVSADSLVLRAGAAIGTGSRALSTSVATLEASGAALYVIEDDAIKLAGVTTSIGNLVMTTINGAIAVDGAVAAGRNVLLAAGGANADLVLLDDVTSGSGSISLRAGRDLLANGAVRTSAVGQTVDLVAARNLAMGEGASVTSSDGAVLFTALGNVTVETINAGNAGVGISAGASVFDQDEASEAAGASADIDAGSLRISAGNAIGAANNHLETRVGTLAGAAGAGALFIDERDALIIGGVDVAVGRIDASGNKTIVGAGALAGLAAGGDVALAAAGAVGQLANIAAGGSVQLRAGGAFSMADGVATTAANIDYSVGGNLTAGLFDAGSGGVVLGVGGSIADAQADAATQTVNVRAGSLRLSAGGSIGATANAIETAVATLAANAAGDIVIRELDGLSIAAPGLSAASGNVVLTADSGTLDLAQSFSSAAGKDLTLGADRVVLQQSVRGNGGKLSINAANPLGDVQAGTGGNIDQASLAHLAGGYAQVVFGAGGSGQDVRIDGSTAPVSLHDALLLNVAGGGVITLAGQVAAQGVDARGAVAIDGVVTIVAGNGSPVAGGDMIFGHSIDGAAAGAVLTLFAGGDSVVINGAIGAHVALAGLSIHNAANVRFAQGVTVAGAVVINATGIVRFDGPLTLDNGALTIRGASEVIIGDVVLHGQAGVVVIEANTLTLNGDVQGAGTVLLRPTDISRDIVVGGASVGSIGNSGYAVSSAQLAHLASATLVLIGTQGADGHAAAGAGTVTLAAVDFAALTAAPIEVFGKSITVAAGAGTLRAANGIVLDGREGVTLHDSVASAAGNIKVYSANGAVTMAADVVIAGSAGVTIEGAGNLSIGLVQAKGVILRSGGVIVDAAGDDKINISAETVSIIGYGPKLGSGNPVEVQASAIYVSAPTGMVLQDTGADGRTHFYLLDGATMYEQAVGIGAVTRSTAASDPGSPALSAPPAASPAPGAAFAAHASNAAAFLSGAGSAALMGSTVEGGILTAGADGLTPAAQAANGAAFDYWLEDLVL